LAVAALVEQLLYMEQMVLILYSIQSHQLVVAVADQWIKLLLAKVKVVAEMVDLVVAVHLRKPQPL
jgi:hypothetical protein